MAGLASPPRRVRLGRWRRSWRTRLRAGPTTVDTRIIEELRANEGRVGGLWAGVTQMLICHLGAKSGIERVTPMTCSPPAAGRCAIVAANGGRVGGGGDGDDEGAGTAVRSGHGLRHPHDRGEPCLPTSTRVTHSTITSQTSPHFAEALPTYAVDHGTDCTTHCKNKAHP